MSEEWTVDHFFIRRAVRARPKKAVLAELQRVRGIGEAYAGTLYERGIRSISDLASARGVPESIRLCAKHVDDLEREVSGEASSRFLAWLEVAILALATKRPASPLSTIYDVISVGAHRRRLPSTHDIDVLLVYNRAPPMRSGSVPESEKPGTTTQSDASHAQSVSRELEGALQKRESYVGTLELGKWKYAFLWRLSGRVTLVDARFCPLSERGAALLHTTGPAEFNILLRKRAAKMGLTLSEHGLFRASGPAADEKELVHASTEEGIFRALGLKFVAAKDRGEDGVLHDIVHAPLPEP